MTEPPVPLTALSEDQRAQAHSRFPIIRPALEDGVTQAQVARTHTITASTIQRWVKRYREKGLAGLADARVRSDKGKSRRLPAEAISVDLDLKGIATAFVGPTFTLAELRALCEAVWGVHLDGANFRRSVVTQDGWAIPTGRRARPGATGGKPAEL